MHERSIDVNPADHVAAGFLRAARRFPDRTALVVDGTHLSYAELAAKAATIAATLLDRTPNGGPGRTAVLADRSAVAFAGVLGSLFRGHGYVPLNPRFPPARTRDMFARSACRALVVDRGALPQLDGVLAGAEAQTLVIVPELDDVSALAARWHQHVVLGARELRDAAPPAALAAPAPDSLAYLLFTSGSTGVPKGVMVSHRNVVHFVASMVGRYGITAEDRFSQTFDLTFDLSAFDMFVAWEAGAAVYCLPAKTLLKPGAFIREHELTVWFSVPSTGMFMRRFGELKPGAYASLRWSLFCGEALPVELAESWAIAAPGSAVENLYGPTEATIACTVYRWGAQRSNAQSRLGIVPIGRPLPGMQVLVADSDLNEVPHGDEGELLVAGPQVSLGYLDDASRTAAAFVVPPGRDEVHYRTGDRVALSGSGDLCYIGRVDHQVQVLGHRVELGEIEAATRASMGIDAAVALGWPPTAAGAGGVVLFVAAENVDVAALRAQLGERLPEYMVPRAIHVLPELPLNPNGKFDRGALRARLESTA